MVSWISEEQASELKLKSQTSKSVEKCHFCSKQFRSHNSYTAHLRLHANEIDNMVLDLINKSAGPMRVTTIETMSNVNFSIRNSVDRLYKNGKIKKSSKGVSRKSMSNKNGKAIVSSDKLSFVPADDLNKLIVSSLQNNHPDLYNSIINDIAENMVKYAKNLAKLV